MSCDLKLKDLVDISKIYAPEFNMPELHDRVLVFDVMQDGWQTKEYLNPVKTKNGIDSAENVEQNSDENPKTASNEVPQDTQSGSVSEQDLITVHDSEARDHGQLAQGSLSVSVEHSELAQKGIMRQHKIYVHSSWLAVQSKYFRSLFYSGMKESSGKEVHIKVNESEETTHLKLLEAIYKSDTLNKATEEELLAVMELADKKPLANRKIHESISNICAISFNKH
ncbi:uncharacterized protein LOC114538997 [Dendronephthya gigantea]|uniref:uncharacterized protein LOC114538997 n=1 Tax=Dendronephthya gigantea TaxID=151771 RepID=UPI00106B5C40|nr:uncharacterized protein LOC114538997 [Dendronephthya gigantea]